MNIAVTTTREPKQNLIDKANSIAKELDIPYIKRGNYSINKISKMNNIEGFIFIEKDKIVFKCEEDTFFWHPSTCEFKIKAINEGLNRSMVEALGLELGNSILDCTLGLATDSIVFSSIVGEKGRVVGTEINKYISCITKNGLKNYKEVSDETKILMERIEVINSSYEDYMRALCDNSFDVVYFDPMFQTPNKKSEAINSFRNFAHNGGLTKEIISEALRVCKRRVVIKERTGSGEFEKLGVQKYYGNGKFGSIAYGIIEKTKDGGK